MTILIVAYHSYPSAAVGAKRIALMTEALLIDGHEVDILTVKERYYGVVDSALVPKASNIVRTDAHVITVKQRQGNERFIAGVGRRGSYLLKRILRHFQFPDEFSGWIYPAVKRAKALFKSRKYGVIIASGLPWTSFVIADKLATTYKVPFIIDYRDPWTTHSVQMANPVLRWLSNKYEKSIIRRAHHVIVNTLSTKQSYEVKYGALISSKITVIKNGYDSETLNWLRSQDVVTAGHNNTKFKLIHTGLFYQSRRLDKLIEAVNVALTEHKEYRDIIEIISYGPILSEDKKLISTLNLDGVFLEKNFVSYKECLKILRRGSMSLLIVGNEHSSMIPAKIFDYFMVGRPIFCIGPKNSDACRLVDQYNYGVTCSPEITEIKNLLVSCLESKKFETNLNPHVELSAEYEFKKLRGVIPNHE